MTPNTVMGRNTSLEMVIGSNWKLNLARLTIFELGKWLQSVSFCHQSVCLLDRAVAGPGCVVCSPPDPTLTLHRNSNWPTICISVDLSSVLPSHKHFLLKTGKNHLQFRLRCSLKESWEWNISMEESSSSSVCGREVDISHKMSGQRWWIQCWRLVTSLTHS